MFYLKKPDPSKVKKEELNALLNDDSFFKFFKEVSAYRYLYWDKLRFKEPAPKGVSKEALWFLVKALRKAQAVKSPIKDKQGKFFTWFKLDYFDELVHEIDLHTGGELVFDKTGDKDQKQILISRGVLEEAIASSQLEGANTSRLVAKRIIQEGRKPRNQSEQMIVNNFNSLRAVEDEYKDREMSLDLLIEIHALITQNTKDEFGKRPRLRKKGEKIKVTDRLTGDIYHEAPSMSFVLKELERFFLYANDQLKDKTFTHPLIKAILLHFWIAYLHPFTDGNGRLARLVFYWYLLRKGYWAFMYLPISLAIKKSPNQYAMSFVYTEQDDNDLNYFIDYNLKKIKQALKDFKNYVGRKSKENAKVKERLEFELGLNLRQIQLLQYLSGAKDARTSLSAHMQVNGVSRMTAYKDLKRLINEGFLEKKKLGRSVYYYGTQKVNEYFNR